MSVNSAFVFHLAQVPIKRDYTALSQTENIIIAQNGTTPPPSGTPNPPWWFYLPLVGFIIVSLIAVVIGRKQISSRIIKTFQPFAGQAGEGFAIPIKLSNVRTENNYRADIEGAFYVVIKDPKKASALQSKEGIITQESVANVLRDRFDAAIRQAASAKDLETLHTDRDKFCDAVQESLKEGIESLGLELHKNAVVIASVDESNTYNPNNYFDAKILEKRTETIQNVILATRKKEIDTENEIREKELKSERDIRETELTYEEEIEIVEQGFQEKHLDHNEQLEKKKIDCEFNIESHKNTQENELEKIIEKSEITMMREIEQHKATEEKLIQAAKGDIEKAAIDKEKVVSIAHKELTIQEKQQEQEIEQQEMAAIMQTIQKEIEKLQKEKERAEFLETITTAIEKAQVTRENEKTQLIHDGLQNEIKIIEGMAKAEEERYKAVPLTNFDSLIKLIREELFGVQDKEKLTEITAIIQAFAPQKGVLGDSSIYTFANGNGNGEDIDKLMLSTSGMHLINSFLNTSLGQKLLNDDNGDIDKDTEK
ncbi:MAG: SPFH domain-containing protein [Crocosphaera sp.]